MCQLQQLLRTATDRWQATAASQRPLLDGLELQRLQQFALSRLNSPLTAQRDVQQLLLGDRLSTFTGNGYEFAENRLFQAGDDARFINWRLYARSGEVYRKVFHEERRPQLWLVVDRRSSMRFGTRTRLKVTAAVRQALVHLYQAQQQQIAVGAVLLEEPLAWLAASTSASVQQDMITRMTRACPPLDEDHAAVAMDTVIRQLQSRLLPGSIVILLSDFHDLQQYQLANLHQLAQQHTVMAVQILDDIELRLPHSGRYRIADSDGVTTILLDCNDTAEKEKIEQQLQLRQQQIAQWLTGAGIHYRHLLTSEEPFSLTTAREHVPS